MMRSALVLLVSFSAAACHKSANNTSTTPSAGAGAGSGGTLSEAECKGLGGQAVPDESCPMKLRCVTTDSQKAEHSTCVMKPDASAPAAPEVQP
jgi:hypothetical protein